MTARSLPRTAFPLPVPLGDRKSSIWGDSTARIYPEMCVDRRENGLRALRGGGRLSLRDVLAPRLENLGAALQQVGALIRLNDPASRHMGEAGLRDLRRDAGLCHPRPRARTEPVNRRGDPGAFTGNGPPVREGNTNDDSGDSARARSSTPSAPVLNGTENSRPAFILDAGIVHVAASTPISSQRAPRASPARTAVSAIISTHNTADGCMYFTRRIAPSAAATSRCRSAR